jgi:hypothetical protein
MRENEANKKQNTKPTQTSLLGILIAPFHFVKDTMIIDPQPERHRPNGTENRNLMEQSEIIRYAERRGRGDAGHPREKKT